MGKRERERRRRGSRKECVHVRVRVCLRGEHGMSVREDAYVRSSGSIKYAKCFFVPRFFFKS